MPWYRFLGCHPPDWKNEMVTIMVDYVMIIISGLCLAVTIYGTYRYVKDHRALRTSSIKPSKPLYIGGLLFFIVSSITLLNALAYDGLYLICPQLDDIEGPIYHALYFLQIFCLWVMLFLRVYSIFATSEFKLSRITITAYIISFAVVIAFTIPAYFIFESRTDSVITLPYVILSVLFSSALLVTFVRKLFQIFAELGTDEYLLKTMVKHTILAVISIICTAFVIIMLTILYIKHGGDFHQRYSVLEELMLELFILVDIVSNFVCVLLSYKFFDASFQTLCGSMNEKIYDFMSKTIESSFPEIQSSQNKTESHTTGLVVRSNCISSGESAVDDEMPSDCEKRECHQKHREHSVSKSVSKDGIMLQLSNRFSKSKSTSHHRDITKPLRAHDGAGNNDWNVMHLANINKNSKLSLEARHSMPAMGTMPKFVGLKLRPFHSQPVPGSHTAIEKNVKKHDSSDV